MLSSLKGMLRVLRKDGKLVIQSRNWEYLRQETREEASYAFSMEGTSGPMVPPYLCMENVLPRHIVHDKFRGSGDYGNSSAS
jgi:hypothetical protein